MERLQPHFRRPPSAEQALRRAVLNLCCLRGPEAAERITTRILSLAVEEYYEHELDTNDRRVAWLRRRELSSQPA